jgi:small subunit ribosomal protein S20
MPQKRAARKEMRKSKKKHKRNTVIISEIKTLTKRFDSLLTDKKFNQAKELLKKSSSKLQKASTKGVIRGNTAARKISRLSKKLHKAAST